MMRRGRFTATFALLRLLPLVVLVGGGCSPRVIIASGTTVGLKATPGDTQTRPPQVTLGYKRAELALVPTAGKKGVHHPVDDPNDVDAFSTLASFFLSTEWFGDTTVQSFIATGHAAQEIQSPDSKFTLEFSAATLRADLTPAIKARQDQLFESWKATNETQAQAVLDAANFPKKLNKSAKDSLQDYLLTADTDSKLVVFEQAFASTR